MKWKQESRKQVSTLTFAASSCQNLGAVWIYLWGLHRLQWTSPKSEGLPQVGNFKETAHRPGAPKRYTLNVKKKKKESPFYNKKKARKFAYLELGTSWWENMWKSKGLRIAKTTLNKGSRICHPRYQDLL